MNRRDLGTHMVELHDQGTLDIIGSNTRLTLPAHEVVELLRWLSEHNDVLEKATRQGQDEDTKEVVTVLQAEKATEAANQDEPDVPMDEP